MPARPIALAALLLLASGCSDTPGTDAVAGGSEAGATLRVVVVDEAVRPLEGAAVALPGLGLQATTGVDGTAALAGVPAGAHVVHVAKVRYLSTQVTAVLDSSAPDHLLQVQLAPDPVLRAFHEEIAVQGYIECGTSLVNPCETANFATGQNITNDASSFLIGLSADAAHIQSELVWDSTQAATPQLGLTLSAFAPGCPEENYWVLNRTEGASPILLTVAEPLVDEQRVGGPCPLTVSVSPSGPLCTEQQTVPPNATVSGLCAGMTVQQRFTIYTHAFYNYKPYPGWRITADPIVPPPPQLSLR